MRHTVANPQKDGYTKIANEIMDALGRTRIPGEQRQVLDVILRKTYGWNKCEDVISLSQFQELTGGMKKPSIIRAIKILLAKKLIISQKANYSKNVYKFNKNCDEWSPLAKKLTLAKELIIVSQKANSSLAKKLPTKDTSTKEKKEKKRPRPPKIKYLDSVFLSELEYQKLQEVLGQKSLDIGIEKLDYSITVKGGKYKDHYKTLLNWFKREFLVDYRGNSYDKINTSQRDIRTTREKELDAEAEAINRRWEREKASTATPDNTGGIT